MLKYEEMIKGMNLHFKEFLRIGFTIILNYVIII